MRHLKTEFKENKKNNLLLQEMYKGMGVKFIGAYSYKNYSMIVTESPKELLKCVSIKNMKQDNNISLSEEDIVKIVKKFGIIEYEISGKADRIENEQGTIYNSLYIFEKPKLN